jgi:hypothetical protein
MSVDVVVKRKKASSEQSEWVRNAVKGSSRSGAPSPNHTFSNIKGIVIPVQKFRQTKEGVKNSNVVAAIVPPATGSETETETSVVPDSGACAAGRSAVSDRVSSMGTRTRGGGRPMTALS